jgi:nucleotide-binding universal stress UspA family protein
MNLRQEMESGPEPQTYPWEMEQILSPKQDRARPLPQSPSPRSRRGSFRIANILVPLDFSRRSLKALKYALPFAERFHSTLHLVHAFDYEYPMSILGAMPLAISEAQVARNAKRRLEATAKKHSVALAPENCHVVKGHPDQAVCQLAQRLETDLIVTTTHGYTGLRHVLLGSTAERIVQHSPCGVLVVREHEREFVGESRHAANSGGTIRLKKILVPLDFSECSMVGLDSAVQFAKDWGAELVAFNCVPLQTFATYGDYGGRDSNALAECARQAARDLINDVVSSLRSRGIIAQGVVALGAPAQNICDYARINDVDLIITSTHGSSGLVHLLLGSTAEHVVRYAHCPVLVMPGHARGGNRND